MGPCEKIAEQMGGLFSCSTLSGYIRIRTPFLYPDGDVIDLFYRESDGVVSLSDLGATFQWLNTQMLVERRSNRQIKIVQDICLNHGVVFRDGRLMVDVPNAPDLAWSVTRLAQAALRVADIAFTLRTRAFSSMVDEVAEFLRSRDIRFQRDERLQGYSQKNWIVDFHTHTPRRDALVNVLTTSSKSSAMGIVENCLAEWVDLDQLKQSIEPPRFISLFDDTQNVWEPTHYKMLDRHSLIARWTNTGDFLEKLDEAA